MTIGRQFYGDPNDLVNTTSGLRRRHPSVSAVDLFRADASIATELGEIPRHRREVADTASARPAVAVARGPTPNRPHRRRARQDKLIRWGIWRHYYTSRAHA